jgi:hypothetical protein
MTQRTEKQLANAERKAQNRLQKAQAAEAEALWGTKARDDAREAKIQASQDLARIEAERARPQDFEEQVTLVGPNPYTNTDSAGIEWVEGKAPVPRSVAERLVAEFEGYSIEEDAS